MSQNSNGEMSGNSADFIDDDRSISIAGSEEDNNPILSCQEVIDVLTMRWMNEKRAPKLLPAQPELLRAVFKLISEQNAVLTTRPALAIRRELIQQDLDTTNLVKYVLADYLRTRIKKIDTYSGFVVLNDQRTDSNGEDFLTDEEYAYACEHFRILYQEHMRSSVLNKIPASLQAYPIQPFPLNKFVLCQPKQDVEVSIKLCNGSFNSVTGAEYRTVALKRNRVYCLPFEAIEDLLNYAKVHLE
ncbi:hypothetical protein ACOME3_008376 [Neoechinorhynchus agilis]